MGADDHSSEPGDYIIFYNCLGISLSNDAASPLRLTTYRITYARQSVNERNTVAGKSQPCFRGYSAVTLGYKKCN